MKKLMLVMAIGAVSAIAACNNSADKTATDSTKMTADSSKMTTDSSKMTADSTKMAAPADSTKKDSAAKK